MKRILLSAVFVILLCVGAFAQITVNVQIPDSLVGKSYLHKKLNELESRLSGIILPPALDPCKSGPTIISVSSNTDRSLSTLFDGQDVFSIQWKIIQNGETLRSGEFSPSHNRPEINFPALKSGTYQLKFSGVNCAGSSVFEFVVPKPTSEVVPEIPNNTDWTTRVITSGLADHMMIAITGEIGNRTISDLSTYPLPAAVKNKTEEYEYQYLYMVNADIIRQKTPLRNYKYQSDAPIRIWKALIRSDIDNLNHWSNTERSDYYSPDAAATFSYNTSIAYYTAVFNSGTADKSGFLNFIPQSYNPASQFYQWGDVGEDTKLPDGHVFIMRKGIWSLGQIQKKGVTHYSNYDLPWNTNLSEVGRIKASGLTYNDVPKEAALFNLKYSGTDKWVDGYNLGWWPDGPLSQEKAIAAAKATDVGHAILIAETEEGSSYMPNSQPMWGHFYKELRKRYDEYWSKLGKPYYIAHNYYTLWPEPYNLGKSGRVKDKDFLTLSASQLPRTEYSPGGNLSSTNLILEAVYLGAPDIQRGAVFETIFRLETIKRLGYEGGVFLAGQHEWRPNNLEKYAYTDGDLYAYVKMPLDPNTHISYGFLAHVFGKLFTEWGTPGRQEEPRIWPKEWTSGVWFPKQGNTDWFSPNTPTSFSYLAYQNTFGGFNGSQDLSQFSQNLFASTYGQVEGGTDQYLKFRLDGGSWIVPENVNANDIVNAYYDQRGIVHSRSKDGKTSWFYLNPFSDNLAHKLEVILPNGHLATKTVAGNAIHVTI